MACITHAVHSVQGDEALLDVMLTRAAQTTVALGHARLCLQKDAQNAG
jgi:hypothetical protein